MSVPPQLQLGRIVAEYVWHPFGKSVITWGLVVDHKAGWFTIREMCKTSSIHTIFDEVPADKIEVILEGMEWKTREHNYFYVSKHRWTGVHTFQTVIKDNVPAEVRKYLDTVKF